MVGKFLKHLTVTILIQTNPNFNKKYFYIKADYETLRVFIMLDGMYIVYDYLGWECRGTPYLGYDLLLSKMW